MNNNTKRKADIQDAANIYAMLAHSMDIKAAYIAGADWADNFPDNDHEENSISEVFVVTLHYQEAYSNNDSWHHDIQGIFSSKDNADAFIATKKDEVEKYTSLYVNPSLSCDSFNLK